MVDELYAAREPDFEDLDPRDKLPAIVEDLVTMVDRPSWWPECPYPEEVFPGEIAELADYIPDELTRTRMAGVLGRHFWMVAESAIWDRLCEATYAILGWRKAESP